MTIINAPKARSKLFYSEMSDSTLTAKRQDGFPNACLAPGRELYIQFGGKNFLCEGHCYLSLPYSLICKTGPFQ